jgi:formiminoglutamase
MSGESSSEAGWFSLLESQWRVVGGQLTESRPDDPRLGEIVEFWQGDITALKPGRGVIVGFPQDEGVRRNKGRPGAAAAPNEIRRFLYRLTPWDGFRDIDLRTNPPLDAGNVRMEGSLEESQQILGKVVGGILATGAVPIVLGGGHETAYGHYLAYGNGKRPVAIINLDAHLDVRPSTHEGGHSGSPFRQAMEHPTHRLPGNRYVCLGAQPHSVSEEHMHFVTERSGVVRWCEQVRGKLCQELAEHLERLGQDGPVYVTIDADVVQLANVPGVSAPNVSGLSGSEVLAAAYLAGQSLRVSSLDLVEINPALDRDGQSSRWAALLIWRFLIGLANRGEQSK